MMIHGSLVLFNLYLINAQCESSPEAVPFNKLDTKIDIGNRKCSIKNSCKVVSSKSQVANSTNAQTPEEMGISETNMQ